MESSEQIISNIIATVIGIDFIFMSFHMCVNEVIVYF